MTTKMTVTQQATPLRSFTDIYNGGKRLLVRKGTAQLAIIKNAKLDQPLHNIYSTMDDSNYLLSSCKVECVEDELRVGKKKNVNKYFSLLSIFFQTNPDSLFFTAAYYATKSNSLNPLILDEKISVPVAMAFTPNSEILETLSPFLLKLKESGVLQKIKQKWNLDRQGGQQRQMQESGTVLGFENLSFPFLVLAFGIIVSMMLAS